MAYSSRRHVDQDDAEPAPVLRVKGCASKMISGIVTGKYVPHSQNHGKTVWKRDTRDKESEVLIYFWDDRDGPELTGWWFGPVVGGDQVWAYHPSRSANIPPEGDWNVPHDGPIDPSFRVLKVGQENDREEAPREAREAPRAAHRGGADRGREAEDIRQVEELRKKMEEHKKNEEEIRRKISEKEQNKSQHDAVQQFKEKLLARALDKNRGPRQAAQDFTSGGREQTKAAPDRPQRPDSRSPPPLDRRRHDDRSRDIPRRDAKEPLDDKKREQDRQDRRQPLARDFKKREPERHVRASSVQDRKRHEERERSRDRPRREDKEPPLERDDKKREPDRQDRRRHDERERSRDRPRRDDKERLEREERDEKKREQERQAKEEERRKHEEELERKRALRRAEEEEARKKVEEERRKEREKRQKEEDELREKERQRREVEEKQRAEQERQQEEERLRQAAEQQAAVQVLQVLQKLSTASPDSFEELKVELKDVLAEQLPRCGRQEPALKAEAERVVEYVEKYMEQLKEHQKQVEELRVKQEKEMAEKEAKTQELLAELDELVLDAEDAAVEAFEASSVLEDLPDSDCAHVLKVVKDFETIAKAAMVTCVKCADFMVDRRGEMDEAERLQTEVTEYVQGATPRVQGVHYMRVFSQVSSNICFHPPRNH
mmetsp:Transcript_33953/g.77453  ORF Transcript_33953/g.77453 Transcript_33953/m.77453 type:complete len:662 (+) Transcript_33953:104-2089(+)